MEEKEGTAIASPDLLVCAICGTELHPEMARVPSFQMISKKIGYRVLVDDLAAHAFCKRHEAMVREEGEDTFEYKHAFAVLKKRAQQNEADEKERVAIRAFLHVHVTDERGEMESGKQRQQKEKRNYRYLSAGERDNS